MVPRVFRRYGMALAATIVAFGLRFALAPVLGALGRTILEASLAEREKLEEALRARLDELGIVNRRKIEFLTALAHVVDDLIDVS